MMIKWLIALYLAIGFVIGVALNTAFDTEFDGFSVFSIFLWPVVLEILLFAGVLNLLYMLGKWLGEILGGGE